MSENEEYIEASIHFQVRDELLVGCLHDKALTSKFRPRMGQSHKRELAEIVVSFVDEAGALKLDVYRGQGLDVSPRLKESEPYEWRQIVKTGIKDAIVGFEEYSHRRLNIGLSEYDALIDKIYECYVSNDRIFTAEAFFRELELTFAVDVENADLPLNSPESTQQTV